MVLIMIRFAELGLKSEKVRRRFLQQLADDIEESLFRSGIENLMEVRRSRIFIDLDDAEGSVKVLKQVPGIYSFSFVERAPAEKEALMEHLKEYGTKRLKEGMTYGLKVKRTGRTDYTSQEIAVEGGRAVMSHLSEGSVKVDLTDPDIWFEVEIRGPAAYLFTGRIRGIGGMPSSSQGSVLLFLPSLEKDRIGELADRALLSHALMRKRGCRVRTVVEEPSAKTWKEVLTRPGFETMDGPEILDPKDEKALSSAVDMHGADGLVFPFSMDRIGKRDRPFIRRPVAELYPTVAMSDEEVKIWLDDLFK